MIMKKAVQIFIILSALLLTFIVTKQLNVMQNTEEIWKAVPGYEGYYEVSDQGRIRSIAIRKHFQPYKKRACPLMLRFNPIKGGYLIVRLYKDGNGKDNQVGRVVLSAFKGCAPNGYECDHIDSDTSNNNLSNLRWLSPRENIHHAASKKKHITSSKYIGVFWDRRSSKWMSRIGFKRKTQHLGTFQTEEDAHFAYQKALTKITENETNIDHAIISV